MTAFYYLYLYSNRGRVYEFMLPRLWRSWSCSIYVAYACKPGWGWGGRYETKYWMWLVNLWTQLQQRSFHEALNVHSLPSAGRKRKVQADWKILVGVKFLDQNIKCISIVIERGFWKYYHFFFVIFLKMRMSQTFQWKSPSQFVIYRMCCRRGFCLLDWNTFLPHVFCCVHKPVDIKFELVGTLRLIFVLTHWWRYNDAMLCVCSAFLKLLVWREVGEIL